MTSRKIPESAVENLVSDLEGKANVSLSNLSAAGQAKFDAKANVSNTVTTDTAQTITEPKTFNATTSWKNAGGANPNLLIFSDGFTLDGTKPSAFAHSSIYFRSNSSVEGLTDSNTLGCVEMMQTTDMTLPDLNFLIRNPNKSGWVGKFQVVSALPANPDSRVFYFIPG